MGNNETNSEDLMGDMTEKAAGDPASGPADRLRIAYAHCMTVTRNHYENFPVAALFLPAHLRRPISVIYAFARTADDFADEGQLAASERLRQLDEYARAVDAVYHNRPLPDNPVFVALRDVVEKHPVTANLFHALLTAFRMDVVKGRYADYHELAGYCRHSANPIGRLVLQLCRADDAENLEYSDSICTALQLINFLQDLEQDYRENGRIYLPQNEMAEYGVGESDIAECRDTAAVRQLIDFQIQRARRMLEQGLPLGGRLRGRAGLQIRLTIHGGLRVLHALQNSTSVFARPRLGISDWVAVAASAVAGTRRVYRYR